MVGGCERVEKTNWVMHEYRLEGKHSLQNLPKTANNEWVICRIFKKSSDGKIVPISGFARNRNCGVDSEAASDLPQLMDFSSDENHTRTTCARAAEGSHVTCFSNPMEDPRDITPFDDFSSSSSSRNFRFSPFPFVLPQNSVSSIAKAFLIRSETVMGNSRRICVPLCRRTTKWDICLMKIKNSRLFRLHKLTSIACGITEFILIIKSVECFLLVNADCMFLYRFSFMYSFTYVRYFDEELSKFAIKDSC
ncbi:hypothetical protein ABFS82_05G033800 [Erythranthe guttata]|uniref:protein CUP-SHAPED COTYLEDON 2-like n=1 Tax=Erythranthe guttata TaxID=4155 RepID=UPI00064DA194|nr:PREDICTED: protein CUP-SHAPED COTYLEDON 2-like [Erythranthe guttata]|eukprot:XP_012846158.1 PREDICTED: protein CUP-SHAPED COTYLEDON 2-like [Erythranthe guttata]